MRDTSTRRRARSGGRFVGRREASALGGVSLAAVDKAIEQRVIRSLPGKPARIPVEEVEALALLHEVGVPLPTTVKRRIRDWLLTGREQQERELALGGALVIRVDERVAGIGERAARYAQDRDAFIEREPEVKGGEAVIRGTRLTASAVHARLAAGDTLERLAEEYDYVPREALEAAALYAETHPRRGRPRRPWSS